MQSTATEAERAKRVLKAMYGASSSIMPPLLPSPCVCIPCPAMMRASCGTFLVEGVEMEIGIADPPPRIGEDVDVVGGLQFSFYI